MVRFLQFFMLLTIMSCVQKKESTKAFQTVDWSEHKAVLNERDSLWKGSSYLSVYSEIYSYSEARTYDLTVTVSLKNIYKNDTVYIERADYYNTKGEKIRNYFDQPIYLKPPPPPPPPPPQWKLWRLSLIKKTHKEVREVILSLTGWSRIRNWNLILKR
jgi:hypothetical protein